jgi:predicted 3-demethylubiquinone-9 3-methyltransferase (glyoxalase superfamily)
MATLAQRITPCLWFDGQAEEAAAFYVSVFDRSRILQVERYDSETSAASGQPEGSVMTVSFELDGQAMLALNGGPHFTFSEAVSFIVNCETQEEIDYFWERLSEGGDESSQQCGWLKDRYGLSWQVVPTALPELLRQADAEKAQRVMAALMRMKKLDIEALRNA